MRHYNLDDWAEFAVGAGSADHRIELQRHLDQGCTECGKTVAMWNRVREMAAREHHFMTPESAMHYARTLFRVFPPKAAGNPVIEWCRMVFDSRRAPALAGVRGGAAPPSRFLFQSGRLILDVMMEPRSDDDPVSLVGQISDPANPAGKYGNLDVSVVPDAGEVSRTRTNATGEFQMMFQAAGKLLLLVELEDRSVLVSPLPLNAPKTDYS